MPFCSACGNEVSNQAIACVKCGAAVNQNQSVNLGAVSQKDWLAAVLLCFFFGWLGVHRFYVGKIGTGILMLLTFGGLGIWTLIDFIIILTGGFKDSNGLKLKSK